MVELARQMGTEIVSLPAWKALWAAPGLQDRVVMTHRVHAELEVRSRMRWIGSPWLIRGWGRAIRLYVTEPSLRLALKSQLGASSGTVQGQEGMVATWEAFGYGLFVGRK